VKPIKLVFPAFVLAIWLYVITTMLQPTEIVAVHQSDILVKNFPLTEPGRIRWWQENRATIKEK